jgi:geranylgeranyl pyrophosphate synthase
LSQSGKTPGKDNKKLKKTFVTLVGQEKSAILLNQLYDEVYSELKKCMEASPLLYELIERLQYRELS